MFLPRKTLCCAAMKIDPNTSALRPDDASLIWMPLPVMPALWPAIKRGITNRCPMCGCSPLFQGYLRVVPRCRQCQTLLAAVPADDAPPYFTILLVGHIMVPVLVLTETMTALPMWLEIALLVSLTTILALLLLRPIKGATIACLLHHELRSDPRRG